MKSRHHRAVLGPRIGHAGQLVSVISLTLSLNGRRRSPLGLWTMLSTRASESKSSSTPELLRSSSTSEPFTASAPTSQTANSSTFRLPSRVLRGVPPVLQTTCQPSG
eukprot:5446700-Pyramimonas_sp.AAC.1